MRILFNAACIKNPLTGIGHFSEQSLKQLAHQTELIAYHYQPHELAAHSKPRHSFLSKLKALALNIPLIYALNHYRKSQQLQKFLRHNPADVYIEPNFILLNTHLPSIPFIYDISPLRHPETHPRGRVRLFKNHLHQSIHQAKAIVTISEFSKSELLAFFDIAPEKIFVSYCGASAEFKPRTAEETAESLSSLGLTYRQFILVIGTFEPRKNLRRVCEAYAQLPAALRSMYPLVLCGASGWGDIKLSTTVEQLIQNQEIRILQYVSNQTLYDLSSAAKCSCYASIYEGFGLPVLEAMQSNTPIISSNISSMPEVAGDAGILVNPFNTKEISQAMQNILEQPELCAELMAKGLIQAQQFSWEKTAAVIARACEYAAHD